MFKPIKPIQFIGNGNFLFRALSLHLYGVQHHHLLLRQAIKKAWPNGWTMNCHHHLPKNCSDYLQKKVGMSDQQKRHMINLIFGQNAVA